jgi:membrane protease YdiL (CAAX protease family)
VATVTASIKRHPVLSFFALVFTIRASLQELRARLIRWRVGAGWYMLALLLAPLLATALPLLLALALRAPEFLPAIFTAQDPLGLLLPALVTGLWVGFFEELGWTGFAVPWLRQRHSVLTTGLLVGIVWGAFHFPLFRESGSFSGALPATILLVKLFSWLPAYRMLMVWLYDRTESLLVVMLMHASMTATSMALALPALSPAQSLTSLLTSATAWWLIVALVAMANRGHLTRRAPLRGRVA